MDLNRQESVKKIEPEEDIKKAFEKLLLLSRMAFEANDIHACSFAVNTDSVTNLQDTVVTLYHWGTERYMESTVSWDHYISVIHPDFQVVFFNEFIKVVKGNSKEVKFDLLVKFPSYDQYLWREYTLSPYEWDEKGRPSVILACSSDVNARKIQKLDYEEVILKYEKADKMKSKYLADMSHEIRTPLNAITGFAELMAFTESNEERMTYYDIIKTNNQMLMQLINDILDLSKIEADVVKISYTMIDVNDLLDSAYASTRLRMPPGVALTMEKGLPECTFGADPVRLLQLITNLANNAIKHTDEGSITIGYTSLPDNKLRFYVRDTGFGIPEEKQRQLFGRFAKVNDYAEGIGLGLAICQGLVNKMGGSLAVESKEGVGSEFSFILPSHDPSEE